MSMVDDFAKIEELLRDLLRRMIESEKDE